MKINAIILILAIISTGLMAGIFFTWSNAVTPGIGKLNDMQYLRSLQFMNRAILNTLFRIIFISAMITVTLSFAVHFKSNTTPLFWMLFAALIIYGVGSFGVTFFGNIPLNNLLDKTDLDFISQKDATTLRATIENKWNFLNWIRTYSSLGSFLLLVVCSVTMKN